VLYRYASRIRKSAGLTLRKPSVTHGRSGVLSLGPYPFKPSKAVAILLTEPATQTVGLSRGSWHTGKATAHRVNLATASSCERLCQFARYLRTSLQ
jgi:hypothetical protein